MLVIESVQRKRRFTRDRPQARAVENLRGSPAPRWKGLDALYTVDPKLPSPARSGADAGPSTSGTPVWRKAADPPGRTAFTIFLSIAGSDRTEKSSKACSCISRAELREASIRGRLTRDPCQPETSTTPAGDSTKDRLESLLGTSSNRSRRCRRCSGKAGPRWDE